MKTKELILEKIRALPQEALPNLTHLLDSKRDFIIFNLTSVIKLCL